MKINKCRICKSTRLTKIFNLGNLVYTGIFPKSKNTKVPSGNLSLIQCRKCKLLQLENNFNSKIMYVQIMATCLRLIVPWKNI